MTQDAPLISVVIPCYNCEKYVRQAVESVLIQDVADVEILVIDDASSDDSIIAVSQLKDKRIKLIRNKCNIGVSASRNIALNQAHGEWVQFLDADDLIEPTKFSSQLEHASSADIVWCDWTEVFSDGRPNKVCKAQLRLDRNILLHLMSHNPFPIHVPLVRRERVVQIGGFTGDFYHEDWDLWTRLLLTSPRSAYVSEPLVIYRHLPVSRNSDTYKHFLNDIEFIRHLGTKHNMPNLADKFIRYRQYRLVATAMALGDLAAAEKFALSVRPQGFTEWIEFMIAKSAILSPYYGKITGPRKLIRKLRRF